MTIVFIQLQTREKDVATLSVCIRVKKPMAQKNHPFMNLPVFTENRSKPVKNRSKPGEIRSVLKNRLKPAGIEKPGLIGSIGFCRSSKKPADFFNHGLH
jgi:hypothetical protein